MRIPFILLVLHLLLLCDLSAAKVDELSSLNSEFESRDRVVIDSKLRDERPNRELNLNKSAPNVTTDSSRADFPCPDAAAIAPCVCTVAEDSSINLDCTFVESEDQLAAVFQQEFPVQQLHQFSMANNSAITELGNILNGVVFESIFLSPGPFVLERVTEYFLFDCKDTLTTLRIWNSQLTSENFPFAILSQMEKLYYIDIYLSSFTWIPTIAAPSLSYLQLVFGLTDSIKEGTFPIHEWDTDLELYYNEIVFVEPGSFFFTDENSATSSGALKIALYYNELKSLQAGTFPLRNADVFLYIQGNQIASIEAGTFVLPETTDNFSLYLSLYDNQLTTVDEAVFGDLMPFVTYLQLYGNPLSCGCDIAWLVLNTDFMAKVDEDTTCFDGTNIHGLDPGYFEEYC